MLLDSPGDTGGPFRCRRDNSPSDLVSQGPSLLGRDCKLKWEWALRSRTTKSKTKKTPSRASAADGGTLRFLYV
jgi:hypothetical protein